MYQILPAKEAHIIHVAEHMREADRREVFASSGFGAESALRASFNASEECYVGLVDDVPVCIFGVVRASLLSRKGIPWMLGTPDLETHAMTLLRVSRRVMKAWKTRFDRLENHVDARNTKSIQWLRWLGFTIHDAKPYGVFGHPFHHFTYERSRDDV